MKTRTKEELKETLQPSIEETIDKMKIKHLEYEIKLRDLEIEKLMNKLNNK